MDSRPAAPDHERRRSKRVRPGPLRVRMYDSEGSLIDISESGALVRLSVRQGRDVLMPFVLDWNDRSILLRGRVVRSLSQAVASASSALGRTEHHVAFTFVNLPPESTMAVSELVQSVG